MIPGAFILILFGAAGVIVAATAIPVGGDLVDIKVKAEYEWHPLTSRWSINTLGTDVSESKILNIGSLLRNSLALTSGSKDLVFVLAEVTTPHGAPQEVAKITQSTGKGRILGNEETQSVVFAKVAPANYVVGVAILGDDGRPLVSKTAPVHLVKLTPGGSA